MRRGACAAVLTLVLLALGVVVLREIFSRDPVITAVVALLLALFLAAGWWLASRRRP